MMDSSLALDEPPNDEETRSAIGQFVDKYEAALAIYIMQYPPGPSREAVMSATINHMTHDLSGDRSFGDEIHLFWRRIFVQALPRLTPAIQDPRQWFEFPIIPTDLDSLERTERDPEALAPREMKARRLAATVPDSSLSAPIDLSWNTMNKSTCPEPETPAATLGSMWDWQRVFRPRRLSPHVKEAMIVAALLAELSKIKGDKHLLASPFPSKDDIRYPSLFLDEDFLSRNEKVSEQPLQVLSAIIDYIPPTILLTLTSSALEELSQTQPDSSQAASKIRSAFGLVKLLSRSDKPQVAIMHVMNSIIEYPELSSWHRQLLTKNLIQSLDPSQARNLISSFTLSICKGFQTQTESATNSERASQSPKPRIKVTTVKFLGQFLSEAKFVPPAFTIEVLTQLSENGTHIDIRCAVVDSLLMILADCTPTSSQSTVQQLFSALEAIVPVAASLNETRPIREPNWDDAKRTGKLPDVYSEGVRQTIPPILNLVIYALTSQRISAPDHRQILIERVLLPIIEESKRQNTRWINIFLEKYFPGENSFRPPVLPVKPWILAQLLKNSHDELATSILDMHHQ